MGIASKKANERDIKRSKGVVAGISLLPEFVLQQLLFLLLLLLDILSVSLPLLDDGAFGPRELDLLLLFALHPLGCNVGLDIIVSLNEVCLIHNSR